MRHAFPVMKPSLVAFALLVLSALSAAAQDACLTGASTLGDQRAIATLRANAESVCPCASAATRGSYKRCTKVVLHSMLVAGDVRAECERTVKVLFKTASCGTDKSPCGRVKPSSAAPVACKVKRGNACTDRANYDQTACTSQDFCADVVEWTAGTCSDVRVRGPFEAGVRTVHLVKQSVVDPMQQRVLDTVVWYPTAAGAGPINGGMGGVVDAPLDLSGGPYPVLLFSHGSCGYPLQSTFLLPVIASRGYVVIAPPHPGNTVYDFPNCGSPQVQVASAQERPQDVIFALDSLLAENATPSSPFFGALDPDRIGMSGHSFGGFTVYFVVAQDARFKVAIPMAPATPGMQASLDVPSLFMLGGIDSVVNNPTTRTAYTNSTSPKYKVEIDHAGHYAFSDLCFPSPDCNPPTTLSQDEAHRNVMRWVIPFLERHLKGDDTFAAFFEAPTPPGVQFEAAP
jgi:predicted dienelactone hydrolase